MRPLDDRAMAVAFDIETRSPLPHARRSASSRGATAGEIVTSLRRLLLPSSSRSVPATTTSPLRRMQTRSQSISTSLRMWLEKKTVRPRCFSSTMRSRTSLRPDRIEAAHRLVEDEQLRIVHERRREPDALEHALRERARRRGRSRSRCPPAR